MLPAGGLENGVIARLSLDPSCTPFNVHTYSARYRILGRERPGLFPTGRCAYLHTQTHAMGAHAYTHAHIRSAPHLEGRREEARVQARTHTDTWSTYTYTHGHIKSSHARRKYTRARKGFKLQGLGFRLSAKLSILHPIVTCTFKNWVADWWHHYPLPSVTCYRQSIKPPPPSPPRSLRQP